MNKKQILLSLFVVAIFVSCFSGCGQRAEQHSKNSVAEQANAVEVKTAKSFVPAIAPASYSPEQKAKYMNEHYWDKFDFNDTTFISQADTSKMLTAFAVYAVGYVPDSLVNSSMKRLMQRASASKPMFEYFLFLAEQVLHNPNSPLRNDELYIPVLESAISSKWLDEYERLPYQHDLSIALQNRVGRAANDFLYTLPSGQTKSMYDIKAKYLLVFISNPGCPMCREVKEQLLSSPMLNQLSERNDLKVLVLYPDEDLEAWRNHLKDYPSAWINGYDKGKIITKQRTYDLRAIPAMYLLDSEKRVLAKDCTDVEYIEHLILQREE